MRKILYILMATFSLSFALPTFGSYTKQSMDYLIANGYDDSCWEPLSELDSQALRELRDGRRSVIEVIAEKAPAHAPFGPIIEALYPSGHPVYRELYRLHPDASKLPPHWEALADAVLGAVANGPAAAGGGGDPVAMWEQAALVARAVAEGNAALLPEAVRPVVAQLRRDGTLWGSFAVAVGDEEQLRDQDGDGRVRRAVARVVAAHRALERLQVTDSATLSPQARAFAIALAQRLEASSGAALEAGAAPAPITPAETAGIPLMVDGQDIAGDVLHRIAGGAAGGGIQRLDQEIRNVRRERIRPAVAAFLPGGDIDAAIDAVLPAPLSVNLRVGGELARRLRAHVEGPAITPAVAALMIPAVDPTEANALPAGSVARTQAAAERELRISDQTAVLRGAHGWDPVRARAIATRMQGDEHHPGEDFVTAYAAERGPVMCDGVDVVRDVAAHVEANPGANDLIADQVVRRARRLAALRGLNGNLTGEEAEGILDHVDHSVAGVGALNDRLRQAAATYIQARGELIVGRPYTVIVQPVRTALAHQIARELVAGHITLQNATIATVRRELAEPCLDPVDAGLAEAMARVLVMAGDLDGAELDTLRASALTRVIRDGAIAPILCDGEDLTTAVARSVVGARESIAVASRQLRVARRSAVLRAGQLAGDDPQLDIWARAIARRVTGAGAGLAAVGDAAWRVAAIAEAAHMAAINYRGQNIVPRVIAAIFPAPGVIAPLSYAVADVGGAVVDADDERFDVFGPNPALRGRLVGLPLGLQAMSVHLASFGVDFEPLMAFPVDEFEARARGTIAGALADHGAGIPGGRASVDDVTWMDIQ